MDDILIAHPVAHDLKETSHAFLHNLASLHLQVAPKKIQYVSHFKFLDFSIAKQIHPLSFKLAHQTQYTLAELQQLCGMVNWLKLFLRIPYQERHHLFFSVRGPYKPASMHKCTHMCNRHFLPELSRQAFLNAQRHCQRDTWPGETSDLQTPMGKGNMTKSTPEPIGPWEGYKGRPHFLNKQVYNTLNYSLTSGAWVLVLCLLTSSPKGSPNRVSCSTEEL